MAIHFFWTPKLGPWTPLQQFNESWNCLNDKFLFKNVFLCCILHYQCLLMKFYALHCNQRIFHFLVYSCYEILNPFNGCSAANGVVIATEKKLPSVLVDEESVSACVTFLLKPTASASIIYLNMKWSSNEFNLYHFSTLEHNMITSLLFSHRFLLDYYCNSSRRGTGFYVIPALNVLYRFHNLKVSFFSR